MEWKTITADRLYGEQPVARPGYDLQETTDRACQSEMIGIRQHTDKLVAIQWGFKTMRYQKCLIIPILLLAANLVSAVGYLAAGDWRRAAYWAASSVCIASVTF